MTWWLCGHKEHCLRDQRGKAEERAAPFSMDPRCTLAPGRLTASTALEDSILPNPGCFHR
jgi:hypothetical protein